MDVALINPVQEGIFDANLRGPFPLGLGYLASSLRINGFDVEIIDCNTIEKEKVVQTLEREKPGIVGITVLSPSLPFVYDIVEEIKTTLDSKIVIGGPHLSADVSIVKDMGADYGLIGESEHSFPRLCRHMVDGEDSLKQIDGLISADGELVNPPKIIENLSGLPFPSLEFFDARGYSAVPVITSRGCPFGCTYCAQSTTSVRFRNLGNVFDEIETIEDYGFKSMAFVDDVFTLDRDRTVELCEFMADKNLRWSCTTRADYVDEELLIEMGRAGCYYISFGVESGVERVRYLLGKEVPDKAYEDAFRLCNKIGIRTCANAMLGLPTETKEDMLETIDFVGRLNPTYAIFERTVIMPGSELFNTALVEGKIERESWKRYMLKKSSMPLYVPDGLNNQTIDRIRKDAYRSFYLNQRYIARMLGRVRGIHEFLELMAFLYMVSRNFA